MCLQSFITLNQFLSFQILRLGFILKIFLNFADFSRDIIIKYILIETESILVTFSGNYLLYSLAATEYLLLVLTRRNIIFAA